MDVFAEWLQTKKVKTDLFILCTSKHGDQRYKLKMFWNLELGNSQNLALEIFESGFKSIKRDISNSTFYIRMSSCWNYDAKT